MTPGGILSRVGTFSSNTWGLRKCPGFWGNWNGKGERVTTLPPKKNRMILILSAIIFESQKSWNTKKKQRIQCTSCLRELLHVLKTYEASNDPTKLISNLSPWLVLSRPHRPADDLSKLLLLPGDLWEKMWWERMGGVSGKLQFCWPFGHDKTGKFGPSSWAAPTSGTFFQTVIYWYTKPPSSMTPEPVVSKRENIAWNEGNQLEPVVTSICLLWYERKARSWRFVHWFTQFSNKITTFSPCIFQKHSLDLATKLTCIRCSLCQSMAADQ